MARAAHDHARHGVFDLCRIVSNFFYSPSVVLKSFHRKYESGGLNLTAGDFAQLSEPKFHSCILVLLTTIRSRTDVPCTNCFPILSLSVCKLSVDCIPPLTLYTFA
jgi:hypothetical protein